MTSHTNPVVPRSRGLFRPVLAVVWGVVVWTALWGVVSVANVVAGVGLGVATLWLLPVEDRTHQVPWRPVAALRFVTWFAWALVKASAVVAWEVVTPTNDINEGIIEIPLTTRSAGLMTLTANVVSLTPGTLTLEARRDPPALYVHVLHLRDIEDVRAQILHIETLVVAAFGVDTDTLSQGGRP